MRQPRTYLGLGVILALMLSACAAGPNELVEVAHQLVGFAVGGERPAARPGSSASTSGSGGSTF